MFRTMLGSLALVATLALVLGAEAQEKKGKQVTLQGNITCAKCELGQTKECATVIVAKKDKKDVVYYFDAAAHKKHHGEVCTEGKQGTVVGTVSKQGDKMVINVKELKFK